MKPYLLLAALVLTPLVSHAESAIGGSYNFTDHTGGPFEGNGSGYKIFLSTFTRTAGVEIGFANFGDLGDDGPHAQAWTSALTLGYPIKALSLYGKVGMALSRVSGTAISPEENHYRMYYGGGLRYGGAQGLGIRAEYERYELLAADETAVASVGLEYRF